MRDPDVRRQGVRTDMSTQSPKLHAMKAGGAFVVVAACVGLVGFEAGTVKPGHEAMQEWLMPESPPIPANNALTEERIELGKMLFFDARLSRDGNISCASCHSPLYGWSDGLPTGIGFRGEVLGRASPTVINTAYNALQMWDGRKRSLEDQAMGPMEATAEMNMDLDALYEFLSNNAEYAAAFERAYPGEAVSADTISRAIASFERTVISTESPFDAWIRGDASAMTAAQVRGFQVFLDPDKGNCAVCHSAPNFTDDGFHNIGLEQFGSENPDLGRFEQVPLALMRGAFKTPTLRDITLTAPYFHDGTAASLMEVVEHYERGGDVQTNLSPNMKALDLTQSEKEDLVAFLEALTSDHSNFQLPRLPAGVLLVEATAEDAEAELAEPSAVAAMLGH